ncbi:MAG: ribosome maturation factor RimP [Oscillospiraceae bacterium]|nr:ribosome maturation factor RimP [Oscillospiraceae bacterium]
MEKETTVQIARRLVGPVLDKLGLLLWDVRFEKEGGTWYLRYYIDKEGGVGIADLEAVSRAVDKALDEADPIDRAYVLEVSSPGAERRLTQDWHYKECIGKTVRVRLIRPVDGVREFTGGLAGLQDGAVTIILEDGREVSFAQKETAFVKLYFDFDI